MTPSNLTLAERERLAYISGDVQLAQALARAEDGDADLADEAREEGRAEGYDSGYAAGRADTVGEVRDILDDAEAFDETFDDVRKALYRL